MVVTKKIRWIARIVLGVLILAFVVYWQWSNILNLIIPYNIRTGEVIYKTHPVSDAQFEQMAQALLSTRMDYQTIDTTARSNPVYEQVAKTLAQKHLPSLYQKIGLDHIDYFRKAGIREYDGPQTCMKCHSEIEVKNSHGGYDKVSLKEDVLSSIHFRLNMWNGFTTVGFDGRPVHDISMGKIDRACGIPGSFTWTGWAVLITTHNGEVRSDGCGQCHIGGNYGPPTGTMLPGYQPTDDEFNSIDCLICHAQHYDMNEVYVVKDANGKLRWHQDRSLESAMSVTKPTNNTCLRCHQHNFGGDLYPGNVSAHELGYEHPRLLHPGAKRGMPFSVEDVHYLAGVQCLDCHEAHGHKIARGDGGTDLIDNDLPGVSVSCTKCHGDTPHIQNKVTRAFLNAHTDKIACETCHIPNLKPDNVVLRDWANTTYVPEEGIYIYTDKLWSGAPDTGIVYKWWNGWGTFMAGALGDNPNGLHTYYAFTTHPDSQFKDFNYKAYYDSVLRPIADVGKSKIWPFKRFNARMYEDMNNQGPFGGMILPFDYVTYYTTGDSKKAVEAAMKEPIMKMLYGDMFKYYIMDDFMHYMGIKKGWTIPYTHNIQAKWMRQDATLMIDHYIRKNGALQCQQCHAPAGKGIMPFEELGYPPERVKDLRNLKELQFVLPLERSEKGSVKKVALK
jgi:hypothetical protein